MYIAHMLGTSTSSALEAVYGQQKNTDDAEKAQSGVHSWRQDRVRISEAALALLELAGKEQARPESDLAQNGQGGQGFQSAPHIEEPGGEAGQSGDPAKSGGQTPQAGLTGGGSGVADIDARIKALQQKIFATHNSDLPEDTKSAIISGLQSQISQLAEEKQLMESQAG